MKFFEPTVMVGLDSAPETFWISLPGASSALFELELEEDADSSSSPHAAKTKPKAQDGQQGEQGMGASHDVCMLLFDDRKARRRPPGRPRSASLRPSGVTARCSAANAASAPKVTSATTMQAASWPAVP